MIEDDCKEQMLGQALEECDTLDAGQSPVLLSPKRYQDEYLPSVLLPLASSETLPPWTSPF